MKATLCHSLDPRVVPLSEHLPALGRREQAQLAHAADMALRPFCDPGHSGEQGGEVLEQAWRRIRVDARAVRRQLQRNPVGRRQRQSHGVVGALEAAQVADPQAAGTGLSGIGIVLEHVEGLEQRRAGGHLAPALDLRQRGVLELLAGELALLEALQPSRQELGVVHPCSHRQGVDEHADHGLDTGQSGRPAGDRTAEDHVLLAAVAADEHGPGAEGDGLQSQFVPRRQRLELRGDLAGEPDLVLGFAGISFSSHRGGSTEDAEGIGGGKPRKLRAPERLGPRHVLLPQPDDVVAERPRRR